jgi:hypothetical protein
VVFLARQVPLERRFHDITKGLHVKLSAYLAIALAAAVSSPALLAADGSTTAQPASTEAPSDAPKKVRKVCVREQVSGTNRIKRVCHALGEERARDERAKGMDDIGSISSPGMGN